MCMEIDKHCEIGHKRLLMSSIETENQLSYCGSTIEPAYKKFAFSKQACQFLIKTPNFDEQAEKFLITPVKKLKKISM